jgi:hypothetical protein
MAQQTCVFAQHATLSSTTADTITFSGHGRSLAVTNRDSSVTLYFKTNPINEVQTTTLSGMSDGTDTVKLTWDGNESTTTIDGDMNAAARVVAAQSAIDECGDASTTYPSYAAGDIVVTAGSDATHQVFTFSGASVQKTDVGAITVTGGAGGASGTVAETTKGGISGAAADDSFVVLPLQTKILEFPITSGHTIAVSGTGNAYSVEVF